MDNQNSSSKEPERQGSRGEWQTLGQLCHHCPVEEEEEEGEEEEAEQKFPIDCDAPQTNWQQMSPTKQKLN